MKAVEIKKETKENLSKQEEYDEICKKTFSLEVSGAELLALIIFAASSYGQGFSDLIYDFYDDNKDYLEELLCYNDLMSSVKEFECKPINFN